MIAFYWVSIMSRTARKRSNSGIYHIILRGINKNTIFFDDDDFSKLLDMLIKVKNVSECKVFAYCLMSNHVHLLVKEQKEPISVVIKRLCSGYVLWYNNKYARVGPLFQDRFRSEPVESDRYLLTVTRYIIRNPVKAKIANNPSKYKWVCYHDYIHSSKNSITDTDYVLSFFSEDIKNSITKFIEFNNINTDEECLDINTCVKYTDEELHHFIKRIFGIDNMNNILQLSKNERNSVVHKIKFETGASCRQLSRVIGLSRGIIEKI